MTTPRVPPPTNHRVTVAEGAAHTRRHRDTLHKDPANHPVGSHGGSFEAQQVRDLLAGGCKHLMLYHGRNAAGEPSMVLVGRDAQGKDMVGASDAVLESWYPCPPYCDPNGPLNA